MRHNILIIDTSIFLVWLGVPNMDTCNKGSDIINQGSVQIRIESEIKKGTKFVLPYTTLIETGNHIAQIKGNNDKKYSIASTFVTIVSNALKGNSPWIVFADSQKNIETPDDFIGVLQDWFTNHLQDLSLGDILIKKIADYYSNLNDVHIYTCDEKLAAYSPLVLSPIIPRRRS
jgi:hypothetical protein